jgi:hypothetical protein
MLGDVATQLKAIDRAAFSHTRNRDEDDAAPSRHTLSLRCRVFDALLAGHTHPHTRTGPLTLALSRTRPDGRQC